MPLFRDKISDRYLKYSGLGFELAGSVAVFCVIGYFIDQHWGTSPIGLITGGVIGIIGGMYLLIKEAFLLDKAFKPKDRTDEHEHGPDDKE